jgi:LysE type translocator
MGVSEFVLAALLLELTPGPNMAYLATLSLARGRASGFAATAGVAFGLSVHAILAALGAGVLIQRFALIYEVLRWTGVAYLLFLAWEGWQSQAESSPSRADLRSTVSPLFLRGFLSNIFNPKSIIFFVSVVPRFVETEPGSLDDTGTNGRAQKHVCRRSHNDSCQHCHTSGSVETVAGGWTAARRYSPDLVCRSRPSSRMVGLDHETLNSTLG